MKSIQMTAIILWGVIFIAAAFVLGQFLIRENIFDITGIITGEGSKEKTGTQIDDELANDVVIDKIGQETVRVGLNVVENYFLEYYEEYVNYIMSNSDSYPINKKVSIDEALASDYVFYAVSNNIDVDKYISNIQNDKVIVTEAEINSFVDKMFEQEIDDTLKSDSKNGYDKVSKKYSVDKSNVHDKYVQELDKIENVTSNQIILTYDCKKVNSESSKVEMQISINLTAIYKGGRYIVTDVEKIEKE